MWKGILPRIELAGWSLAQPEPTTAGSGVASTVTTGTDLYYVGLESLAEIEILEILEKVL